MPSRETEDLLARLDRLKTAAGASQAEPNERFEKAVGELDRMAGRGPSNATRLDFEDVVWQALSAIPGLVVSRDPQTPGSPFQPDFLVTLPRHKVLVETRASSESVPAVAQQISAALDSYGADEALVVLPDMAAAYVDVELEDDRVHLVRKTGLKDFFGELLQA
jgi:hypothetical protein